MRKWKYLVQEGIWFKIFKIVLIKLGMQAVLDPINNQCEKIFRIFTDAYFWELRNSSFPAVLSWLNLRWTVRKDMFNFSAIKFAWQPGYRSMKFSMWFTPPAVCFFKAFRISFNIKSIKMPQLFSALLTLIAWYYSILIIMHHRFDRQVLQYPSWVEDNCEDNPLMS